MGTRTIITDDLTGKEIEDGTEPTVIVMDEVTYKVYLSTASKETLMKMFKGQGPIARPVARKTTARKKNTGSNASAAGPVTVDTYSFPIKEVRAWARENNVPNISKAGDENPVGERGILTQNVYDKYKEHTETQDAS